MFNDVWISKYPVIYSFTPTALQTKNGNKYKKGIIIDSLNYYNCNNFSIF